MSQPGQHQETLREWLSGLVVMIATIVAFVGFAFASLTWTLIIASAILVSLILFLWSVGYRKQRARRQRDARK